MKCPDQGTWQAFLDDELHPIEKEQCIEHARHCTNCQSCLEELRQLENWTEERLSLYHNVLDKQLQAQNDRLTTTKAHQKAGGFWMISKWKKWTAVAASVVALTGFLSFSPVQEALADALSLFRVQKIQTVKINADEMRQMAQALETKVGEVDLKQFGKMNVVQKPEQVNVALEQAHKKLPFEFRQPTYLPVGFSQPEHVLLSTEGHADFQLNTVEVNHLLKSLGSQTILPETLRGKSFGIHIPAGVSMNFRQTDKNGIHLTQFATPEVTVPQGVDARDLRAALLDLPILPDDFRSQLASIEDWQNTMIVPDTGEGDVKNISVAGHDAIFSQSHGGYSHLVWVDNGVIFTLAGPLGQAEMLKIAQSLD